VFEKNELIYMNGTLILNSISNSYRASLMDQINVLFLEKDYINDIRDNDDIEENKKYVISVMESSYCVNWNVEQTSYFLIPAWDIRYVDGYHRIRNAINGKIYEK